MLQDLINFIRKWFKGKTDVRKEEKSVTIEDATAFEDVSEHSITSVLANKSTTLATSNSVVNVSNDNSRGIYLQNKINEVYNKISTISYIAQGKGGAIVAPYFNGNDIHFAIADQTKLTIVEMLGDNITKCVIEWNTFSYNNQTYKQLMSQQIIDDNLNINFVTVDQYGKESYIEEYQVEPLTIPNVEKCLLGYLKSSTKHRKDGKQYGVPVTFGSAKDLLRYENVLTLEDDEEMSKIGFTVLDERTRETDENGILKRIKNVFYTQPVNGDAMQGQSFSPAYRWADFEERKQSILKRIEQTAGYSAGLLSKSELTQATATEVRRANADTIATISEYQRSIRDFISDVLYSINIWANYYNITPMGEYTFTIDFADPFADSTEMFNILSTLHDRNVVSDVEIRQYYFDKETNEESLAKIEEIKASQPSLESTLGNLNAFTG